MCGRSFAPKGAKRIHENHDAINISPRWGEGNSLWMDTQRQPRFPLDFMFQLTSKEFDALRSQFVISKGRGGRRHLPYAFTEHGAIMNANVLNSERAIESSVQVVRAFVKLRHILASNAELARKLEALEKKYDHQFKIVFAPIRKLMIPVAPKRKEIGFRPKL